jgi:hypothetical protein
MKRILVQRLFLIGFLLSINFTSIAQQQEMYTFCVGGTKAYLLDTAATSVSAPTSSVFKVWTLPSQTAYSAYIFKDTIYQSVSVQGSIGQGGTTGKIRKIRWDGTTIWEYTVSTTTTQMHHDFCPMPNGNVLLIVYEKKTQAEATAKGASSAPSTGIWSEKIIEVKPTGQGTSSGSWGGIVVWEWHLWDHLCQSVNSAITSTYVSSVPQHPELFNINYGLKQDWFHMNGIDYNSALDQIILSSHGMSEIYVIDHSTTTAEAITHAGGNSAKGGDFLYRWGRPQNYGCTTGGNNSGFNVIHDAHWVPSTNPNWPNYMCAYNNNSGSTVQCVIWQPPYNGYNYTYTAGSIIGPTTCIKPTIPSISAQDMGNSQQLDNGNILITSPNQKFYEVNGSGTTYQQVSVGTNHAYRVKKCDIRYPTASAGTSAATVCANTPFNLSSSATSITETTTNYTYSWSSTPAGFTSTDQNPTVTPTSAGSYTYTVTVTNTLVGCTGTASVNVTVSTCTDIDEINGSKSALNIYPNPTTGIMNLESSSIDNADFEVLIYDAYGKLYKKEKNDKSVNISDLSAGVYFVVVKTDNVSIYNKKVILIK